MRIVLVNHRRDADHLAKMTTFWRERGIDQFLPFNVMNRGGTLFVDEMQYSNFAERAEAEAMLRGSERQSGLWRAVHAALHRLRRSVLPVLLGLEEGSRVRQRVRDVVHGDHGRQARAREHAAADLQELQSRSREPAHREAARPRER